MALRLKVAIHFSFLQIWYTASLHASHLYFEQVWLIDRRGKGHKLTRNPMSVLLYPFALERYLSCLRQVEWIFFLSSNLLLLRYIGIWTEKRNLRGKPEDASGRVIIKLLCIWFEGLNSSLIWKCFWLRDMKRKCFVTNLIKIFMSSCTILNKILNSGSSTQFRLLAHIKQQPVTYGPWT